MKQLPLILSKELFLKIDYLICRFMKSKKAFKIKQNQSNTWFTIKKIKEKHLGIQYQFHIRFDGADHWLNAEDTIDFDFYIRESEFKKILGLE